MSDSCRSYLSDPGQAPLQLTYQGSSYDDIYFLKLLCEDQAKRTSRVWASIKSEQAGSYRSASLSFCCFTCDVSLGEQNGGPGPDFGLEHA